MMDLELMRIIVNLQYTNSNFHVTLKASGVILLDVRVEFDLKSGMGDKR